MIEYFKEAVAEFLDLNEPESALRLARDFLHRMEQRVGRKSFYTLNSTGTLIDVLVKLNRSE